MGVSGGPNIVRGSSLILELDAADRNSYPGSGTTWNDLSGNGNNFTLNNSPTFSTANNGRFAFNGTNQDATLSSLNLQQNFTLDGWFNSNVLNGFGMFGQGPIGFPNQGLHVWYVSDTSVRFGMYSNDTDFTVSTSIGNWYNMVFTYNNSNPFTKQMYLNGVALSGTPQQSQAAYAGSGTFRLGSTYGTGLNYGNGSFAGIKVYNRILSATEIKQNYDATKSRFGLI
jgi:hypothetical protein